MTKPNIVPVLVRMDPELHEELKATAERNDRSMAAEIRVALREHCAKHAPQ